MQVVYNIFLKNGIRPLSEFERGKIAVVFLVKWFVQPEKVGAGIGISKIVNVKNGFR